MCRSIRPIASIGVDCRKERNAGLSIVVLIIGFTIKMILAFLIVGRLWHSVSLIYHRFRSRNLTLEVHVRLLLYTLIDIVSKLVLVLIS